DSHRYAERDRIRRGHDCRDPRADDSHIPHRRRRRRARARHHPPVRRAERPAFVHEPDDAVYEEYAGRASRHADGVPSPVAGRAGSMEVGKMADLVVWKPAFFGVKPELVIKGGFIAGAMMGDGNASIPTPQPVIARPMFGAYGGALPSCSVHFVSQSGLDAGAL